MRIVLVGSVSFSEKVLLKFINLGAEIVGVISKKESPENADFCDLGRVASENAIPLFYPSSINDEHCADWIRKLEPDYLICCGWSKLIRHNILSIPKCGAIGFHPSLLPFNRGRHPLIWALVLGLESTGTTFFFMDEGADTGDIISQEVVPILDSYDAQLLYEKISETALSQIDNFFPLMKIGLPRIPQEKNLGNVWRKRSKIDGRIDFRMSSQAICNLVRALTKPYVGAHLEYLGKDIKIWKVTRSSEHAPVNCEPGKVLKVLDSGIVTVRTFDGSVDILVHEFEEMPKVGTYL